MSVVAMGPTEVHDAMFWRVADQLGLSDREVAMLLSPYREVLVSLPVRITAATAWCARYACSWTRR